MPLNTQAVTTYYGAIEAGGTKFNCAFGNNHDSILEQVRIPTTTPAETKALVEIFFDHCIQKYAPMTAIGVACFGPVDLDPNSKTYGSIIQTPKPNWSNTPITAWLADKYNVPVGFDLDVNGAALGEIKYGAGNGLHSMCYVTIGTGIGVGVVANGQTLNGLLHPEFGHIALHKIAGEADGICESHGNCAAGLASGPAIQHRWGAPAETFEDGHPMWSSQAHYIAAFCNAITLAYSPQRIVLGGGVMQFSSLLAKVQQAFAQEVNGFLPVLERTGGVEQYIVSPGLNTASGVAGAFIIAQAQASKLIT